MKISVSKRSVANRSFVLAQLATLCAGHEESEHAFIFIPRAGKHIEFLKVVKFHKLEFDSAADTPQEAELIRVYSKGNDQANVPAR